MQDWVSRLGIKHMFSTIRPHSLFPKKFFKFCTCPNKCVSEHLLFVLTGWLQKKVNFYDLSISKQRSWMLYTFSNVLKSATLLSATPEHYSKNRERRKGATPFYQKERMWEWHPCFWEERKYEQPSSFTLFFLKFSFFLTFFFSK